MTFAKETIKKLFELALILLVNKTRNSALYYLVGVSFDRALQFHRWLGRWAITTIAIHFVSYLAEWVEEDIVSSQFSRTKVAIGLAALGVGVLIWITSLEIVRRKLFEIFYYPHFTFIAFYVLSVIHSRDTLPYILAGSLLYLFEVMIGYGHIFLTDLTLNSF